MTSLDKTHQPQPADHPAPSEQSARVLEAISDLQDSEALYRSRLRGILDLGSNELAAAQFLSRRSAHGRMARAVDITKSLGITSSATSVIVTRLVGRGFVSRNADPRDRRGQTLKPTDTLVTALAKAIGKSRAEPEQVLSRMSGREAKRIIMLLGAVSDSLDRGALTAPDEG